MMLAAVPAATVIPMSKNLGFVAVGAYGLIACFIAGLITRQSWTPQPPPYRILSWVACVLLILAHVPGAIAGRIAAVKATPFFLGILTRLGDLGDSPKIENQNVVVVNAPCLISIILAPSYKAYHGQPLPKTIRNLAPGCTSFEVERTDDKTLVIQSQAPDIFSCDNVGPLHFAYPFRLFNLAGMPQFEKGDRQNLSGLTVEILEVDQQELPARVAFRFDSSLDSPGFHWLWFDWQTFSYRPFAVPRIGEHASLAGPGPVTLSEALRQLLGKS